MTEHPGEIQDGVAYGGEPVASSASVREDGGGGGVRQQLAVRAGQQTAAVARRPLVGRAGRGFCGSVAHICHDGLSACRLHRIMKFAQHNSDIPFACFLSLW